MTVRHFLTHIAATRRLRSWIHLIVAGLLGGSVAVMITRVVADEFIRRLLAAPGEGSTLGERYGIGALLFGSVAVLLGSGLGGVAGGFVAAGAYRLGVRRPKMYLIFWYVLGVVRGVVGMLGTLVITGLLLPDTAGWAATASTAIAVWAGVWVLGQVGYDVIISLSAQSGESDPASSTIGPSPYVIGARALGAFTALMGARGLIASLPAIQSGALPTSSLNHFYAYTDGLNSASLLAAGICTSLVLRRAPAAIACAMAILLLIVGLWTASGALVWAIPAVIFGLGPLVACLYVVRRALESS